MRRYGYKVGIHLGLSLYSLGRWVDFEQRYSANILCRSYFLLAVCKVREIRRLCWVHIRDWYLHYLDQHTIYFLIILYVQGVVSLLLK